MSTNINNNGLPNIDDLQNLANELFKALPNEFPKEISLSPDKAEHPRAAKIAETILYAGNTDQFGQIPAVSLSSVSPAPPAFSGFGASPSLSNYSNTGASALYPNAGAGFNPKNTNSSSGVEENHDLNINNPHNGFYDANLKNGNTPQLNEESLFSGISLNHQYLPFQAENSSFEIELQAALASVDTQFKKRNDNPFNGNDSGASYYFLEQNPFAFDKRNTDIIVGNSFDAKEISQKPIESKTVKAEPIAPIKTGADNFEKYLPILKGKKVGIVTNQTGILSDKTHLVDFLLEKKINIQRIYAHS